MRKAFLVLVVLALCGPVQAVMTEGTVVGLGHATFASYTTGTAALELEVDQDVAIQILEVRVHLTASGATETMTMTINSGLAVQSHYDVLLDSQAMTSVVDHVFRPTAECLVLIEDTFEVSLANAAGKEWGAVILWRKR